MGGEEGYLSPIHFSTHCKVSFLSGLWLWSHRSLLLFSTTKPLRSESPTELSLFDTKRASLYSIFDQHKENTCLYRLSSHVFSIAFALCHVHSSMEFFPLTWPSCTSIPQSYLMSLSFFPSAALWKAGQKRKILVPKLKNLTFYSDCAMATLPCS